MNPRAMPLNEYIFATIAALKNSPEVNEVVIDRAKPVRFAKPGDYDAFFRRYNEGWAAQQKG
jgi:uncharacterized oxidoreductase